MIPPDHAHLRQLAEQCNSAIEAEYELFNLSCRGPILSAGDIRAILPILQSSAEPIAPEPEIPVTVPIDLDSADLAFQSNTKVNEPRPEPITSGYVVIAEPSPEKPQIWATEALRPAAQPKPAPQPVKPPHGNSGKRGPMSDAGRAAIAAAQRERHAKKKAEYEAKRPAQPVKAKAEREDEPQPVPPPKPATPAQPPAPLPQGIPAQAFTDAEARQALLELAEYGYLCTADKWHKERPPHLPTMPQLVRALKLTSFRDLAAWAGLKYEPSPFRRNGETVPV